MVLKKNFKVFNDNILNFHPDLREHLKPNDVYPEIKNILKNGLSILPFGSFNTRVIIHDGEIVERVFKTPSGQVVSLFPKPSNEILDQVA